MAKPLVTDELWAEVEPVLPKPPPPSPKGGRPPVPPRIALEGILFVLRTGIAWEDLPAQFGCSGMTCWRRLRDWHRAGCWDRLHEILLAKLREADRIDFSRAALDSAQVRALKGGIAPGRARWTGVETAASITS